MKLTFWLIFSDEYFLINITHNCYTWFIVNLSCFFLRWLRKFPHNSLITWTTALSGITASPNFHCTNPARQKFYMIFNVCKQSVSFFFKDTSSRKINRKWEIQVLYKKNWNIQMDCYIFIKGLFIQTETLDISYKVSLHRSFCFFSELALQLSSQFIDHSNCIIRHCSITHFALHKAWQTKNTLWWILIYLCLRQYFQTRQ